MLQSWRDFTSSCGVGGAQETVGLKPLYALCKYVWITSLIILMIRCHSRLASYAAAPGTLRDCSKIRDSTRNIGVFTGDHRVFGLPVEFSDRLHARLKRDLGAAPFATTRSTIESEGTLAIVVARLCTLRNCIDRRRGGCSEDPRSIRADISKVAEGDKKHIIWL